MMSGNYLQSSQNNATLQCFIVVQTLTYDFIARALELATPAAVEELITQCVYSGLVQGRMNQRDAEFHVSSVIGRDVSPEKIDGMIAQLMEWYA